MASTSDFVRELDEQIGGIRTSMTALSDAIGTRAEKLKALELRRREIIGSTVLVLLPNLEAGTIAALVEKLPGFITADAIRTQIIEMESVHRGRLNDLAAVLRTYESDVKKAQSDLSEARNDLGTLEAAFPALTSDDVLARLVKSGYGTDRYRRKWYDCFSFDFSFFQDWKNADELVAQYNAKDYNQLAGQFIGQSAAHSAMQAAEKKLRELQAAKASHDDTANVLAAVPKHVLDRIQAKLKAYLDTLSPGTKFKVIPDWLSDLADVEVRISALTVEQRADQTAHSTASSNLTKISALRTKVTRSGKRDVPDQYIAALRSSGSSASSSSHTTVHVHSGGGYSGPGFWSGVLWGEMDSYFAEQRAYDRGRRDASYSPGYGGGGGYVPPAHHAHVSSPSWQQADTSGQS